MNITPACNYDFVLDVFLVNRQLRSNPQWRGPDNIHGFVLDGKSYRQGWATAQTLNASAVLGVRITTCNLTTIARGRWSLVADLG